MHRLLIIHTPDADLKEIAVGIKEGAEAQGIDVDLKSTKDNTSSVSFHPYDLILAGSSTKGIFKAKIDSSLDKFLAQAKRTAGQDAAAYVKPHFFVTNKALKKVMAVLEEQGCVVKNFMEVKDYKSAVKLGRELKI